MYVTQYVTNDDLRLINAALAKGEVVRIRHTNKGGTKITRESSQLISVRNQSSTNKA